MYGIFFQYVHSVAHNLAYFLHIPKKTLYDLGFALLPAMTTEMQIISEIAFFIMLISTILWMFSPFYHDNTATYQALLAERRGILVKRKKLGYGVDNSDIRSPRLNLSSPDGLLADDLRASSPSTHSFGFNSSPSATIPPDPTEAHEVVKSPTIRSVELPDLDIWRSRKVAPPVYLVHILSRFFGVLVFAQTLRIICFLVTSLPGPNYHCRPFSPYYDPPTTLREILFRSDAFFSCGDLVFSSHTTFIIMCALTYWKYGRVWRFKQVFIGLVIGFGLLVISARKHYSLDVVIAFYVVPLIWIVYDSYYPDVYPKELLAMEFGQLGCSTSEFVRLMERVPKRMLLKHKQLSSKPQLLSQEDDSVTIDLP